MCRGGFTDQQAVEDEIAHAETNWRWSLHVAES